jgi:hypothetical protein
MVLASFDRPDHHERWPLPRLRPASRLHSAGVAAQLGCQCRDRSQPFLHPECVKRRQRGVAVRDDSSRGPKYADHAAPMTLRLSRAAILRVGQRNQVVDEVDRAQPHAVDPLFKPAVADAGMAEVEIIAIVAAERGASGGPGERQPQRAANIWLRRAENVEQPIRRLGRQQSAKAGALNDGLAVGAEMVEIGVADSVDPGRQPHGPPPPHQSCDIEQVAPVVAHQGVAVRA